MALEWSWWKDWWRLKKWRHRNHGSSPPNIEDIADIEDFDDRCYCDECYGELSDGCSNEDGCMGGSDLEGEGKQVLVGICAMAKKSQSKPMKEILTRLEEFEYIKVIVFPEEVILKEPVEDWPIVDCLISFHSKGFPLDKAIHYANIRNPFIINNLPMQYDIQDRRRVYAILDSEGIEIPRYAVLDRDSADPKHHELVESEDHVEVNGVTFNKPFVEKPVSAEDHNIYIYYPTSAGGGSQRLFRKIGSRSSVYSPESRVRKTGSYIYEDFMPTDGTDVKVYTVGPDYAHAEARKSPALDGKVERDSEGKEIRYPVILSNAEKLISRKVCLAFKQTVCGFDLLRANGKSFVCDVNGFSFVKNSNKYYDDCAKILGNMILRELAPTLHIPWSVPFQLDDPPIVPTTFGKMMELRCVVAVIRHGDRTPKQKMKVEVRHPKFFEIFAKYDGYKHGHVKLKRPKQLQEILDTARSLLSEIQHRAAGPELEEKQGKLEQLKSVLEMYGHFSGINRKVQMKYQPRGRPRGSSSDDDRLGEPSLVLILKWGGELTPAGRIQAEELGRIFRCMYPGGQGRHLSEEDSEMLPSHGEYAGAQGLGLLRLHSTFRHDLKIYASDEGRVQMTAAAFAKGLLALEGELTPILVQMVKSANTNGLLDNDCDSSKYQNMVKTRLHELLQQDREFTREDREQINPGNALSINDAMDFVKNPVKCCQHVQMLIQKLMDIVRIKKDDPKTKDAILYHGETWELMGRRWGKIEKDFCTKNKRFDISKIPDIYDCIKYDLQHNNHTLQFDHAEELYIYAKYLADIVIPQEYGLTVQEKMTIGQGICTPLLKKIRADLQRNIEESGEETVNRLNPRYSHGVSSPGRHVRTRLYFTSESHVHSLLTVLRYGGLLDVVKDEQWRRAMEYVSMVSELNYMSQIVVMLYEDPTKDPSSEERFHVELHFSPGVNCCVQKNLPPGPGFRPHSRNESSHNLETTSQCSTRIEEEDADLGVLDDDATISPQQQSDSSPPLIETEEAADSTLDSPTTSRAIDMMDLDPNMMDEPYDSGFLQGSAPIPISARTVAGHEAARLGSQLAASQRQRREREASGICEPRARSYDHQRQEKPEKTADKLQYQSLDAVNKEDDQQSRRFNLDELFYERVESLVGVGNQSRGGGPRNSESCLGASSNYSLSASSPDLPNSQSEIPRTRKSSQEAEERYNKAAEKYSSCYSLGNPKRNEIQAQELEEYSMKDDSDFWDFGESQLLEKSPSCQRIESPADRIASETVGAVLGPKKDSQSSLVRSRTGLPSSEASSAAIRPRSKTVLTIKIATPPRDTSPEPKGKSQDDRQCGSSRDVRMTSGIKAQELRAMTSKGNSSLQGATDSREFADWSSRVGVPIGRRRSQEISSASSAERKLVMTCSPSYLGIPVALPHSISSPELPAPMIETILQSSGPLVTLHNKSLASPSARSPPGSLDYPEKPEKLLLISRQPIRQSCNPMALQTSETKRYGRSKSALTLPTVNDPRGEFAHRLPEITSPKPRQTPNDLLPMDLSSRSLFRRHCEAPQPKGKEDNIEKTSALEDIINPKAPETPSNSYRSQTVPEISRETYVGFELASPVSSNYPPTNDRPPNYVTNSPPSLCDESYNPKTSRPSIKIPLSQSDNRRPSFNVPEVWGDGAKRPETDPDQSPSPFSTYLHQNLTSSLQTYRTIQSLSSPNSRRASLTVLTAGDRFRSMTPCPHCDGKPQYKCSSSLPSRTHSDFRITSAAEASDRFRSDSNPRRSSLTVSTNQDREVLGRNEDFLHRQDRNFVGRSRSLSPCPQRCLCYNCNVAVLIQESVNLSPAERLNFQTYFFRSLSHKFSNCTCYRRSLESAEASRRVSRSASPNSRSCHEFNQSSDSKLPSGRWFDPWQYPKSRGNHNSHRDSCPHQRPDDYSANLTSLRFHRRVLDHGRRLERRQSSPQNIDSSPKHSCSRSTMHNDFLVNPCSGSTSQKEVKMDFHSDNQSAGCGTQDFESSGGVDKSNDVSSPDNFETISQSESALDNNSDNNVRTASHPDSAFDYSTSVDESRSNNENPDPTGIVVESIDSFDPFLASSSFSSTPSLGIVPESNKVLSVDNQSSLDGKDIQDQRKSSSLSRQLSCPEVVIDACSTYPTGYPMTIGCHCYSCLSVDDDDLPKLTNQSQGLKSSSPAFVRSSMDILRSEQRNDRRQKGRPLPRQFSCPEIIAESPNCLISRDRQDVRASRRSFIGQSVSEMDSECWTNSVGLKRRQNGKFGSQLDRHFLYSTEKDDHERGDSLGDRSGGLQIFRKSGFLLPRQVSCPEITASCSLSRQQTRRSRTSSCCDEECCLKLPSPSLPECSFCNNLSTTDNSRSTLGARCKDGIPCCSCIMSREPSYASENNLSSFLAHKKTHAKAYRIISSETNGTMFRNQRYKSSTSSSLLSSPSSHPRLQTQRSFSSPDTRPSIIQEPDPTCTARRHRHSISGQMSYFKLLGYNVSKKLTGSANSLFSTAVISGSSSAPNLKDMVPPHASVVAAIEGFGGVPPIRPLETLHNALSLRQLDSFLDMMTSAPLFRTPASSPPKFPSPGGSIHGGSVVPNLSIGGINREYHSSDLEAVRYRKKLNKSPIYITPTPIQYKPGQDGEGNDLRNQLSPTSPNSTGWSSEPQSFLSSDPSSPAPTSAGECSMSMSLVSNDGTQPFAGPIFSATPCLDIDFNDFCMSIDQDARGESRGSISYTDYYSNEDGLIRKSGPDLAHLRERAARDETPQESVVDEDEEHTLTLRQTEEQRKQDVKFIFEQIKESSPSLVKPSSSFKKIGRFRVESMEIADEDVRIKEAAAAAAATAAASSSSSNLSLEQTKASVQEKSAIVREGVVAPAAAQDSRKSKGGFSTPQPRSGHKGKLIARSKSVSTPQNVCPKTELDYTSRTAANKTGSFSTMSCEDLENWKASAVSPPASSVGSPSEPTQEEPILTVASSLKGSSHITVGFNVQEDKKD